MTRIVGTTRSVSIVSGAPAWFTSLANKEWGTPVTNWLGSSGVKDPLADSTNQGGGHKNIIDAWTGMLADQDNKMIALLANGGHSDYWGNEVYSCDLSQESPAWTRRRDATAKEGSSGDVYVWSDGRPAPTHTNNSLIAAEGRWFMLGMTAGPYNGSSNERYQWEYDHVTDDWVLHSSTVGIASTGFGLVAMYWPAGRLLIKASQDYTYFFSVDDPSTIVESANGTPGNGGKMCGGVDTTNDIMLTWQSAGSNNYRWRKLATSGDRTANSSILTASGTPPSFETAQFHWHAPSGAFLTWAGTGSRSLMKLTPTVDGSGNYTALAWSTVSGFTGAIPTWTTNNLMYSKINFIEDMGNGDSAMVLVPRYATDFASGGRDVFVCRLTGGI